MVIVKFEISYSLFCKKWFADYKKDRKVSYYGKGNSRKEALINLCIVIKELG